MRFLKTIFIAQFLLLATAVFAQKDTVQAPYLRFPHLPPLQLLMGDSSTVLTKEKLPKNKPVLLMIFSPDCSHCQHTAEEMVKYKDSLQGIEIVMATMHTITQMNAFAENYGLKAMPNVVLGKDVHFVLPPFYGISSLPLMAFYKRNGDLITATEGSLPMRRVLAVFEKAGK